MDLAAREHQGSENSGQVIRLSTDPKGGGSSRFFGPENLALPDRFSAMDPLQAGEIHVWKAG